jgi:hypothetical protein
LLSGRYVTEYSRLCTDLCAGSDGQVPAEACLAGENAPIFDVCRTGQSNLRHYQAQTPDANVVSYLHEVVDFCPRANDSVVDAPAIYSGIRTDLHVIADDAPSDVWNLRVLPIPEHVTETIRANDRSCVQLNALSDLGSAVNRDVRINPAARTDAHSLSDHGVRANPHAVTQLGSSADNRVLVE